MKEVKNILIEEILKEDPLSWLQCWLRFHHELLLVEIAERSYLSSEAVRRRICKITDRVRERMNSERTGN